LLSEEENTSDLVEPPTAAEMNAAITNNIGNLLTVVSNPAVETRASSNHGVGESGE